MSVITLSVVVSKKDRAEARAAAATMPEWQKEAAVRDIKALESHMVKRDLKDKLWASFTNLTGDDRVKYENAEFQVSDRYTVDGDTWVEGRRFRVNISQFTRDMHSVTLDK